jgi:F-type H+-transporting ATPase subunit b
MKSRFSEHWPLRTFAKSFAWTVAILLIMTADVFAASGGGESHGSEWKDFAWRMMNFVILAGLLYWLLAKKVKEFFSGRRDEIKLDLEQAQAAKEEAEKKYKEYTAKLEKATEEIAGISEMIKSQGLVEKERIIADAKKAAVKMKEDTQSRVEQEMKKAGNMLRAEAVKLSVEMAEELLKRNIQAADHDVLVKDYLDKVVSKH